MRAFPIASSAEYKKYLFKITKEKKTYISLTSLFLPENVLHEF